MHGCVCECEYVHLRGATIQYMRVCVIRIPFLTFAYFY